MRQVRNPLPRECPDRAGGAVTTCHALCDSIRTTGQGSLAHPSYFKSPAAPTGSGQLGEGGNGCLLSPQAQR